VSPASASRTPKTGSWTRTVIRFAWIATAVYAAVVVLGVGATILTATPAVCGTCHEMAASVATWEKSAHARVGCPDCHETRRPWYRYPETLVERATMLKRDIQGHWALAYGATPGTSGIHAVTISDSTCEQCHDPSRTVTVRTGILIKHAEHAKRNKSCLSCHLRTAHPDLESERPLLLMGQCFTCHGRSSTAKAPGTCDVCHQAPFSKRPASHGPPAWTSAHGKAALTGRQQCSMCHDAGFCRDCHGLEMPHPTGWDKGRTGHGLVASKNRQVCQKCHTQKPDVCGMCHHKGYEPAKGPWIAQHPSIVERRGVIFCLKCHGPTYCIFCHTAPGHLTKGSGAK
jgi:cytochrome c nitrite reductase small subunit